jgi:hypothetical protein
VPPGVYFTGGPYTVTAWVKMIQANYQSRLFDFGNGQTSDNVFLAISHDTSSKPYLKIFNGTVASSDLLSSSILTLGAWTHLASVFDGSRVLIYLNGTLVLNQLVNVFPRNIVRQKCFVGKSNSFTDQDANAYFDEIKIYNRNLSNQEIAQDLN